MFDSDILRGVRRVLATLHRPTSLRSVVDTSTDYGRKLVGTLEEIASCNPNLSVSLTEGDAEGEESVRLVTEGKDSGIEFRAIPEGNILSAFLYAVLNAAGVGFTLSKELLSRAARIANPVNLVTYIGEHSSRTPRTLQMINELVAVNPNITNTVVDTRQGREDMKRYGVISVPTVTCNDVVISEGWENPEDLVRALEKAAA